MSDKKKPIKKVTKKASKKTTKKMGRPTKYDPAFCEEAIEVMKKGFSKEAVAGHLGISCDTLYQWIKKHKDFSDAISIGQAASQLFWESMAVTHTLHTKNGKQINGQVYNLNMKNRFNWNDKKEVSLESEKGVEIKLNYNYEEGGEDA